MEPQAVVVTGASGFIGSWTCERLLRQHPAMRVIGVGRTKGRVAGVQDPRFAFIACDLLRPEQYARLPKRVDAVMHLAGDRRPRVELAELTSQCDANILMTSQVADYAARAGARRLVYASSVYLYAGQSRLPFREDDVRWPASHLGATKLAAEALLAARARLAGMPTTAFRIFTVYGPRASATQFMVEAIEKLAGPSPVARFGAPDAARDLVFVEDVAEALGTGLAAEQTSFYEAYNVGTGIATTVQQLVNQLARLLKTEKPVEFAPAVDGVPDVHQADVRKIRERLGWQVRTSLEEGLRKTIDAFRARPSASVAPVTVSS